ncbi:RES domain-containing protein [Pleurocapsa sp. CCALA 161]|uniref:RES family NAD+ phosphorylase n=1 Tax=Pleurocapsa sp. CCALA 161 TaxID=2107688 RepID=UPI000D076101|nr:RES family NAD+ phosphorylase [Pleurocapsa sp. CCALA 161]PSB05676.1 RES domain-containing protein [Pleurocapsa sp. CCALA 161]
MVVLKDTASHMVLMPPPIGGISPTHVTLKSREGLIRIFDPTQYGSTATSFRSYGPISRFDHHRKYSNKIDPDRSVIYAGLTLSCCLVEVFGDCGVIALEQRQVAFLTLTNDIKLLDIRGSGSMGAGTVAAISGVTQRDISQAWGKYFYEHPELYDEIEGLIFSARKRVEVSSTSASLASGAHNGEDAIVLYERAKPKIESARVGVLNLNHPDLVAPILEIAEVHGLFVK